MDKREKILTEQADRASRRDAAILQTVKGLDATKKRAALLKEFRSAPVTRVMTTTSAEFDDETQSFTFSFSSEFPVERWDGIEILQHTPDAVDLSRLNDGGAFCMQHDTWSRAGHIGVHEKAWLDTADKVCRARARLSKNKQEAREEYLEIKDGIRKHISVTYLINDLIIERVKDGPDKILVTSWTPLENSTVTIPADFSVGPGRSGNLTPTETVGEREAVMADPIVEEKEVVERKAPESTVDVDVVRNEARTKGEAAGAKRASDMAAKMLAVGKSFGQQELAADFVSSGRTYEELVDECGKRFAEGTKAPAAAEDIGMTEREASSFRFTRLIDAECEPANRSLREKAAFEYEAIAAARQATSNTQKRENGMPLPGEVMRSQTISTDSEGGYLSPTKTVPSMIDMLRNKISVMALGARPYGSLVGNVDLPKKTSAMTAYMVGEDEAPTASALAYGLIGLTPKTVAARNYITRSMLKQSSWDVEMDVRNDMMTQTALKFDSVALTGIGGRFEPLGLLNWTGTGLVAGGTNGLALAWSHVVKLLTECDVDNALVGNLAFLTNAKVRGAAMRTPQHATAAVGGWIWGKSAGSDPTIGDLAGYPAHVSNQIPSNLTKGSGSDLSALIFGNWNDFVVATWGGPEIIIDPYTASSKGGVWYTIFQDMDTAVQRAESFAVMKDIITT